jgi:hypothetical protein
MDAPPQVATKIEGLCVKNGSRKRFAARGVPTLSVLSDSVSTGFSGMDWTSLLLMERYNVC